jgi:MFS transporter, OCT family, solute carrier family 22 (organic cation transporter), member 4/5
MEAKRILIHAAKFNKSTLSEHSLTELDSENFILKDDEEKVEISDEELRKSRVKIVTQLVVISFLWFSTIFVYYGLNINSVYLEYWDKYINFIVSYHPIYWFNLQEVSIYFQIVCSIELPGYFMTNILMEKLGRKKTLFIGMIGSGIFCILSEFLPGNILKTALFIAGKLSITISFSCLYIFTVEVFPTNLRHRFFSICAVIGRIGGILTPLTPLLAEKFPSLPLIIFSALSLSSSILLFALPETLNKKLPDTIKQATS